MPGMHGSGYVLRRVWTSSGYVLPRYVLFVERTDDFGSKLDQKWMQHRDFPGGHPSQYYSGPKALNFRVLMGSGVVALV